MNNSDIFREPLPSSMAPRSAWTTWRDVNPFETPAITVILPAGDDDQDLEQRVPCVLEQSVSPHEVLILDTSRDGRHFSIVARLESTARNTVLRYVHSPVVGRAALRRLADRLASGNVKAFAWAGTVVPAGWIERIADGVQRLRSAAIARD